MFEAYNTISIDTQNQSIDVENLDLMLEGQVAGLSCNLQTTSKSVLTLKSLFSSNLFRNDMKSFILYPEKEVTPFLKKNIIKEKNLKKSILVE